MKELTLNEQNKICELTKIALSPINGMVTQIGQPSIIKMISQIEGGPQTVTQRTIFTVSIKNILGVDHLLFSNQNGLWNGVRNMCQDLAYSTKITEKQRDEIVTILWSETFMSQNTIDK